MCEVFELRLRENLLVEFDTPPAPIRSRKIEENKFVVGFRLFPSLTVIVQPIGLRLREASENKRYCGCGEK
jgi:hypothetical protein